MLVLLLNSNIFSFYSFLFLIKVNTCMVALTMPAARFIAFAFNNLLLVFFAQIVIPDGRNMVLFHAQCCHVIKFRIFIQKEAIVLDFAVWMDDVYVCSVFCSVCCFHFALILDCCCCCLLMTQNYIFFIKCKHFFQKNEKYFLSH